MASGRPSGSPSPFGLRATDSAAFQAQAGSSRAPHDSTSRRSDDLSGEPPCVTVTAVQPDWTSQQMLLADAMKVPQPTAYTESVQGALDTIGFSVRKRASTAPDQSRGSAAALPPSKPRNMLNDGPYLARAPMPRTLLPVRGSTGAPRR